MLKLDKNLKYLLACSYGPDSMALCHILLVEGYNFSIAHVNYHFRNESDLEEEGLRQFANINNIKLYVLNNKIKVNRNLEATARQIRYKFFKSIYDYGYDALLVAHHKDDYIETYLLQKERKITVFNYGLQDFSSIFGMKVIRPLLSIYKEDLLNYCKENNVPYAIDSSNYCNDYLRNKIRNEIVSKMNKEQKEEMVKEIDMANTFITSYVNSIDKNLIKNVEYLLSLYSTNEKTFEYAILMLANNCQIFNISNDNIREIKNILSSNKPNISFKTKNFIFVKEYDECSFLTKEENIKNYSYDLSSPSILNTPFFYLDFTSGAENRNVKESDYPLIIRNYRKGDKYQIKSYLKDVNRLYIDWKMPLRIRKQWPLIINKEGVVIYVPRYQKGFDNFDSTNFYVKVKK